MLYTQSKIKITLLQICFITSLLLVTANTQALIIGTYTSPPFSMNEDGEDIGLATEVIRDLLAKSNIKDYSIANYPLARGLVELKEKRIDIFYPYITSLSDNKDSFVLIGPISKYRLAFFAKKDYQIDLSVEALKSLTIGAERGDLGNLLLANNNMHLELTTEKISCLRMALAQRVSACAVGTLPGKYTAAINSIYDQLRYVETALFADIYLALGPKMPAEQVKVIQETYAKLKRENYFDKKQKDYEDKFNLFIKSLS